MGKGSRIEWAHLAFNPGGDASKSRRPAITATRNRGPNALTPTSGGRITTAVLQRCPLEGAIEVDPGRNGRGVRRCVFCASMADVFENRPDL